MTTVPASGAYAAASVWSSGVTAIDDAISVLRHLLTLARVEYTISGGQITPDVALFTVDTESDAAADDLDNILQDNFPEGMVIGVMPANEARVVTVKHAASGDGEVYLADGLDLAMPTDVEAVLWLVRRGTAWREVRREGFGRRVIAVTAGTGSPLAILRGQRHALFTNEGAGAMAGVTLPSADVGDEFEFLVVDTDGLRIVAPSGETIQTADGTSTAAGYAEATALGSALRLVKATSTTWVALSQNKAWTLSS